MHMNGGGGNGNGSADTDADPPLQGSFLPPMHFSDRACHPIPTVVAADLKWSQVLEESGLRVEPANLALLEASGVDPAALTGFFTDDRACLEDTQRIVQQLRSAADQDGEDSAEIYTSALLAWADLQRVHHKCASVRARDNDNDKELTDAGKVAIAKMQQFQDYVLRDSPALITLGVLVFAGIMIWIAVHPIRSLLTVLAAVAVPSLLVLPCGHAFEGDRVGWYDYLKSQTDLCGTLANLRWSETSWFKLLVTAFMTVSTASSIWNTGVYCHSTVADLYKTECRLWDVRALLSLAASRMKRVQRLCDPPNVRSAAYAGFRRQIDAQLRVVEHIEMELETVLLHDNNPNGRGSTTPATVPCHLWRATRTGHLWKTAMRMVTDFAPTMRYAFGFNAYYNLLAAVGADRRMRPASFVQPPESGPGQGPVLVNQVGWAASTGVENGASVADPPENATENQAVLGAVIVLTGPNASGKTTFLRQTMVNLLLTQQYGSGFYARCEMPYLYSRFGTYIGVQPDTAPAHLRAKGEKADSLFQAEARRCLSMLDAAKAIQEEGAGRHQFCVMDELFSGTDPTEAAGMTAAIVRHLADRFPTTDAIITTHYPDVVARLGVGEGARASTGPQVTSDPDSASAPVASSSRVVAMTMEVDADLNPTFRAVQGTSKHRNARTIMRQLGFPSELTEADADAGRPGAQIGSTASN